MGEIDILLEEAMIKEAAAEELLEEALLLKLAAEGWTARHPYLTYLGIPGVVGAGVGVPVGLWLLPRIPRLGALRGVRGALLGAGLGTLLGVGTGALIGRRRGAI